jgi:uridine monophosphate synthetase
MTHRQTLALQLYDIGAVQFGQFMLRSGIPSPIYLDMRRIVSYPQLLRQISSELWTLIAQQPFDFLCGVPYAALSLASGMSLLANKPMVVKRKERKSYGAKRMVEGVYEAGQTCAVIEDIVTSGVSLVETINDLEQEGLIIEHAVAIVDREQGGSSILAAKGYKLHALYTITELLDILLQAGRIDQNTHDQTLHFLHHTTYKQLPETSVAPTPAPKLRYEDRVKHCSNPIAKRLLHIMIDKQTNLALSADTATAAELLLLAEQAGPHICMLKTHVDNLPDFDRHFTAQLQAIAQKHNFLLFEDRKFADIGHIVRLQYTSPVFGISEWADVVTVHVVAGEASIVALRDTGLFDEKGLIIVAQMSTKDTLTDENYLQKAVEIGGSHKDCVIGFVAQSRVHNDWGMLQFTPGVHLATKGDSMGQTYNTPDIVFKERGADVIIVGRGIYAVADPTAAAQNYQQAGWQAYLNSLV